MVQMRRKKNLRSKPTTRYVLVMMDVRKELNEDTCYVRPEIINGQVAYVVHSHEGFPVCIFPTAEIAIATAQMNGLEPKTLH